MLTEPDNGDFFARRGRAKSQLEKKWPEAIAACTEALARDGVPGYRQSCVWLMKELPANADPTAVDLATSTCLVLPDAGVPRSQLAQLALRAVTKDSASVSFQQTLGAVLYRAELYEGALDRLDEAWRLHFNDESHRTEGRQWGTSRWDGVLSMEYSGGTAWMHLFRTLTLHKLGRPVGARVARDKAAVIIEAAQPRSRLSANRRQ